MKFAEMQVGRHYHFRPHGGESVIGECVELGDKMLMRGEELFHEEDVTDIAPVLSKEDAEALKDVRVKAEAVMDWYARDGSVGGAVDPMHALRAALARVRNQ